MALERTRGPAGTRFAATIGAIGVLTLLVAVMQTEAVAGPEEMELGAPLVGDATDVIGVVEQSATLAGPLGIDPVFAIATFGAASWLGLWTPPAGVKFVAEPWVWISCAVLALFLKFGRSTKLTKPFAEVVGGLESAGALVFVLLAMRALVTRGPAAQVAHAGLADGGIVVLLAMATVASVVLLRTALDVLIWISPIPFVDFLFQIAKTIATVGLVLLAILAPKVALAVNVLILLLTLLLVRWAVRVANWGLMTLWDLSLGRGRLLRSLPRDPVASADVGPLLAFVVDRKPLALRTACTIELRAGRWFLVRPRALRRPLTLSLGDAPRGTFERGWTETILALPEGRVSLPPRYAHLVEALARETGAAYRDDRAAFVGLRAVLNLERAPR